MKWVNATLAIVLLFTTFNFVQAQDGPAGPGPDGDRPGPPPASADRPPDAREDHRPGNRWRDHNPHMSEEQVREAVKILRRIDPEKADRLAQALEDEPEEINRVLREQAPNLGRFMAWRRFDPEGFDLHVDDIELSRLIRECAGRLHEALDQDNDEAAAFERIQLEDLVSRHFAVRQEIREHQLAKLRERIEKLQAQIEQMQTQLEEQVANQTNLITERVNELIEGDPDKHW